MFKFKQKDSEFFDLFVESAQYFYQGALMMDEVMLDYSKAADKVKEVVDLEHAADAVNEVPFRKSIEKATRFAHDCVQASIDLSIPHTDGLAFEEKLHTLTQ